MAFRIRQVICKSLSHQSINKVQQFVHVFVSVYRFSTGDYISILFILIGIGIGVGIGTGIKHFNTPSLHFRFFSDFIDTSLFFMLILNTQVYNKISG